MTQESTTNRKGGEQPRGYVSLVQRASELGMEVASLRRYINVGRVKGQWAKVGDRIYVAPDLTPVPARRRRRVGLTSRSASLVRQTGETRVSIEVGLDGRGHYSVRTGEAMLDHLLEQLARHGLFNLTVEAQGDAVPDAHHLVEDVAITLGRVLRKAIGEGQGIRRMGHAVVPLDEALAQVTVDIGGRGYAVVETGLEHRMVGNLSGDLVRHFLERLALEGGMNLHSRVLASGDPHHVAEALFKALARALRMAMELDPRAVGEVPSTKGTISG